MSEPAITWETRKQAAERLQVSVRTLDYMVADGRITAYKLGRIVRFKATDIDALLRPTNEPQ